MADEFSKRERPVVVVGAGIAGLWAALRLAPMPVVVLTGRRAGLESSSAWAQGGIAAALGPDDSSELHAADTVSAGAGLVDAPAAHALAEAAPEQVRELQAAGVPFEHAADGAWVLSREAAHSRARVARVGGDRAGVAIVSTLVARAREAAHIELREGWHGSGLWSSKGRCHGVIARDEHARVRTLTARAVVLATGGIGGLYDVTTNPGGNRGLALAWAARAGARIQGAEFVQFHPTAIDTGARPAPLATEALRGEGATLIDRAGVRFMPDLHPDAELAPRDIVARAVHHQRAIGAGAWLDARDAVGESFPERFPVVFAACMRAGIDPRHQPIPVAPAVHYHMGGIAAALDGVTDIAGLYAIGEAACTGVHGANRLASNSLLEALVTGAGAARSIASFEVASTITSPSGTTATAGPLDDAPLARLRQAMSRDCGVERDATGLNRLLDTLESLQGVEGDHDVLLAARLIAASALQREESRGAHARTDFPRASEPPRHTAVKLASEDAPVPDSASPRNDDLTFSQWPVRDAGGEPNPGDSE